MDCRCVHIEFEILVSAEAWTAACEPLVEAMRMLADLEWKLWLVDDDARTGGGLYLFRSRAAAEAYARGPIVDLLRASPVVRNVRVQIYGVATALSARTFALPSLQPGAVS